MDSIVDDQLKLFRSLKKHEKNIKEALKYAHGTHDYDDVVRMIISGKLQYLDVGDSKAFMMIEITQFPKYSNLHIFLAGGDLEALIEHVPELNKYAWQNGLKHITLAGRKGWLTVLKKTNPGWEKVETHPLALRTHEPEE